MSTQIRKTHLSDFTPLTKLGEGSFSSVYKVRRNADNNVYALKKVKINNLKPKEKENALNQVRILASLNSQHIIAYKEAFLDQKFNLLCIVMEQANEGDLYMKITQKKKSNQRFAQMEILKAAYHIICGIKELHSHKILHRDLKSSNIFLSNGIYKLGDMNVSKVQNGTHKLAFTQTGTPYYASPQVWRDEPYDSKSDIWSYGCIIYQMCALRPPFQGKDMEDLFKNIQNCEYSEMNNYSQGLSELISGCLKKNPRERPSCNTIIDILQKMYKGDIKNINQNKVSRQKIGNRSHMLKTIKYEDNLEALQKNLPQPKYQRPQSHHLRERAQEGVKKQYRVKNCGKIYERRIQSANHQRNSNINSNKINVNSKNNSNQNIETNNNNYYGVKPVINEGKVREQIKKRPKINTQLIKKIQSIKNVYRYELSNHQLNQKCANYQNYYKNIQKYEVNAQNDSKKPNYQNNKPNSYNNQSNYLPYYHLNRVPIKPFRNIIRNNENLVRISHSNPKNAQKLQVLRNQSANIHRYYDRSNGKIINYQNRRQAFSRPNSSENCRMNIMMKDRKIDYGGLRQLPRLGKIMNQIPIRQQFVGHQRAIAQKYYNRILNQN